MRGVSKTAGKYFSCRWENEQNNISSIHSEVFFLTFLIYSHDRGEGLIYEREIEIASYSKN